MRLHWGLLCKKLFRLASPAAACLMLSPLANAQDFEQAEGRIRVMDHQAAEPVPAETAPLIVNQLDPNSPEAIFTPWASQHCAPAFGTARKPQSLQTPNMIGDFLGRAGSVNFSTTTMGSLETSQGLFDLPVSGRIPKVAENNSAIPRDRFYFTYNHFHGAYSSNSTVNPNALDMNMMPIDPVVSSENFDQNRFTLGLEKTFLYGDMSVEFRMPLVTQVDHEVPGVTDPTSTAFSFGTNDPTGNLSMILKKVLFDWYGPTSSGVISSGAGFTFPTSEGASVNLGDATFLVDDAGVHFSPYMTILIEGQAGWFIQGFAEFDYSTDKIAVEDRNAGGVGKADIPDVINLDVGAGWWLCRYPENRCFKALAGIVEYHFTGQRQDFENIAFQSVGQNSTSNVIVGGFDNRRDIMNLTTGVHVVVTDHINARVAGVVPLRSEPDRQFDSEIVFQIDLVR